MRRRIGRITKPPEPVEITPGTKTVFLAGSIEMGTAENWQETFAGYFADSPITMLNPRRDDWDATGEQRIENPQFRESVEWELTALEQADWFAIYFAPGTRDPITLLEMGLPARSGKLFVCCPEGYWRKGNVDIVY